MSLLELGLVILGEGGTDGIYVKSWIACTKQNCTVSTKFKYKSHGLLLLYTCDTRCGIHDGRKAEKLSLANPALTRLPGLCAYLCSSLIPLWASCAWGGTGLHPHVQMFARPYLLTMWLPVARTLQGASLCFWSECCSWPSHLQMIMHGPLWWEETTCVTRYRWKTIPMIRRQLQFGVVVGHLLRACSLVLSIDRLMMAS